MIDHFLRQFQRANRSSVESIAPMRSSADGLFVAGNVRELQTSSSGWSSSGAARS